MADRTFVSVPTLEPELSSIECPNSVVCTIMDSQHLLPAKEKVCKEGLHKENSRNKLES